MLIWSLILDYKLSETMKLLSALYSNRIGHAVDLPLNSVIQESADYGAYICVINSLPSFALENYTRACLRNAVSFMCNLHLSCRYLC